MKPQRLTYARAVFGERTRFRAFVVSLTVFIGVLAWALLTIFTLRYAVRGW